MGRAEFKYVWFQTLNQWPFSHLLYRLVWKDYVRWDNNMDAILSFLAKKQESNVAETKVNWGENAHIAKKRTYEFSNKKFPWTHCAMKVIWYNLFLLWWRILAETLLKHTENSIAALLRRGTWWLKNEKFGVWREQMFNCSKVPTTQNITWNLGPGIFFQGCISESHKLGMIIWMFLNTVGFCVCKKAIHFHWVGHAHQVVKFAARVTFQMLRCMKLEHVVYMAFPGCTVLWNKGNWSSTSRK